VRSTLAAALAPAGLALLVALLATLALGAGRAEAAGGSWRAYLAPAAACPGAAEPSAPPPAQRRAIACLLDWARARAGQDRLAASRSLARAAALKGRRLAACGEVSHAPCGTDPTAAVRASGYRFARFGENLFAGPAGAVSARDVVAAWLRSPSHRANVLGGEFREAGAALVRARGLLGRGEATVWVVAFGTPS